MQKWHKKPRVPPQKIFYNVKRICQMLDCMLQAKDRCVKGSLKVSGESNVLVLGFTVDCCKGWRDQYDLQCSFLIQYSHGLGNCSYLPRSLRSYHRTRHRSHAWKHCFNFVLWAYLSILLQNCLKTWSKTTSFVLLADDRTQSSKSDMLSHCHASRYDTILSEFPWCWRVRTSVWHHTMRVVKRQDRCVTF